MVFNKGAGQEQPSLLCRGSEAVKLLPGSLWIMRKHLQTHRIGLLLSVGQHLLKGSHRQRLLQHEGADGQVWRHILLDTNTTQR